MTISPSRTQRRGNDEPNGSSSSGKYRFSGFSSRLWIRISSPSRKTSARNPSHFGSKIQSPSAGNSLTRLASIGNSGGFTGSCTPHGIPHTSFCDSRPDPLHRGWDFAELWPLGAPQNVPLIGQREKIEAEYVAALTAIPDDTAKDDGITLGRRCAKTNLDTGKPVD